MIVGISYFISASFPMLAVIFGAKNAPPLDPHRRHGHPMVSMLLAFLSGMRARQRAIANVVIIAVTAGVAYRIGILVRKLLGVPI